MATFDASWLLPTRSGEVTTKEEVRQKSLYTLKTQENGDLVQRGMACTVAHDPPDGEREYWLLTSSSVLSKDELLQGKQVIADRYCSRYPKHEQDHRLKIILGAKEVYSTPPVTFLYLQDKDPKHYRIHSSRKHIHQELLNANPDLVSYTFCGKKFIKLKFEFIRGEYRLSGVEPRKAEHDVTNNIKNVIGAPVLVRGDRENLVVGVVQARADTNELWPAFILGKSDSFACSPGERSSKQTDSSQKRGQTSGVKLTSDEVKVVTDGADVSSRNDNVDESMDLQEAVTSPGRDVLHVLNTTETTTVLEEVKSVEKAVSKVEESLMEEIKEGKEELRCLESSLFKEELCSTAVFPPTSLPDKPPQFIGRETEVDFVMAQVSSLSTRLLTIWGSGGFGKTALSVVVGHRLRQQGISVWFVSLREVGTIEGMIEAVLGVLDPSCLSEKGSTNFFGSLCTLLRSITSTSVLILDNVDDLLAAGEDTKNSMLTELDKLLQQNTNIKVVCTSRESMIYAKLTFEAKDLRIKTLQTSESTTLLQILVPNQDLVNTEKECTELANLCGNAPLGLKLMGSTMNDDKVTPQELLSDLDKSNILEIIDSEDYPDVHRMNKVFEVSFKRLSKECKKTFIFLSFFLSSFDVDAAATVLSAESPRDAKKKLSLIERKSFLDYDANSKRYSIHPLLRAFARLISQKDSEMCPYITESRVRFQRYFWNLLHTLNNQFLTGQSLRAVQCFHREKENLIFCLQDATTCDVFLDKMTDQLTNMDIFLDTIFWTDSTPLDKVYDQFLSKYKDKLTSHSACYINVLLSKSFGVLHHTTCESDKLLSEANDVMKNSSVPPDTQGKLFCFSAFRKIILRQVDEGINFFEKGISLLSSQLSQVVIKALALRIFADCYMLKENTDKASAMMQKALSLIEKHQQLKRIITIDQTQKHEVDYVDQPFIAATAYFLSQFSKVTATTHVKDFLYQVLKTTDQLHESKRCTLEHVQQFEMLASSFESIGCKEEAITLRKYVLDVRMKLVGEENEKTARSYYNLGMAQYKLGDYGNALEAHQHSLDITMKIRGGENEDTAWSYYYLGRTHYQLGDYSSALDAYQHSLGIKRKLLGEDNEETASSYYHLGRTHYAIGDYGSSLEASQHSLDIRVKLLGEDNENTAKSYYHLGRTHYKMGDYSSALDAHQHSLDITMKLLGEDNEITARSYYSLGMTHYRLGDYSGALDASQHSLDIRLKVLGEDNEDTITASTFVSFLTSKLGQSGAVEAAKSS